MFILKLLEWAYKHKTHVKSIAWCVLILNSVQIILGVYLGRTRWFDYNFWMFILALVSWLHIQILFQEEKQ